MALLSLPDVTAISSTNVPLSATTILANWVQVQVPSTNNAADARIGDKSVSATQGAIIYASGGSQFFPASGSTNQYNLAEIFILGTTSDTFEVIFSTV